MRVVRFALLGIAGLVLLALIVAVLAITLFDPNAHKAQLQRVVLKATGRELQLPGNLQLKLFPWVAVELGQASLSNAPGFAAEPMIEIQHARLGVKLLPLLHKRLEIGAIRLDSPTIRLASNAAGQNNWSDLGGKPAATPADQTSGELPPTSIEQLQITHGELQFTDASATGAATALHDLNITTGRLEPGKPFDLQLAVLLQKGTGLQAGVSLKAGATVDLQASRYQLATPVLDLQLKGAGLPAAGLSVSVRFASIDADLKAQTLQLPGLQLQAAGATLSGGLSAEHILDAPRFKGAVTLADGSPRDWLHSLGVELPVTRDPTVFRHLSFNGDLAATSSAVMISALHLKLDDSSMSGRAGLSDIGRGALDFDLKVDRLNADRYLPPAAPAAKTAKAGSAAGAAAASSAPLKVPVELLRSLDAHGALSIGTAVFAGVQYSNLHIGVNAAGGRLHVLPSEAQMYGGQYHGDVSVDASGRTPRVSVDEHVTGIDFAPLLHDMLQTNRMSGRGNAAIKAVASGADSAALLRTLTGNLEFHVDNGALEGADLWYEIRRARALLKQQPIPERTGPEHTVFTALSATGKLTNGVLSNEDLNVAMPLLQVKGRGTADLPAGTLDYHLTASVLKIPAEGVGADAQDIVGFQIPVLVSGTFAAPKVRPDVAGLVKARVQQEIDKRKDEVKQQLQEKLQDKLKGLFGH